jgi:pimeloyl-ACP methyl ester carboxylesterase
VLVFVCLVVAGVIAAGALYQLAGSYADRRRFQPPGRLFKVGETVLHLHQQGNGRPVVVLEAGIAGTSVGWALVQPAIAEFTTACSYDRAGLGWSGKHRTGRTVEQMTGELKRLLDSAGLPGPYILVGHSFGGLLIKAFAVKYPELVGGLVFVDPVSLATWSVCTDAQRRRLAFGARLSRRGAMLARVGVVRASLALLMSGGKGISKRIGRTAAGRGSAVLEKLVGEVQKLPREVWPMIRSHWSQPKSFLGMAAYLECLPASAVEVIAMRLPQPIPVVILSAATASPEELSERDSVIEDNPAGHHILLEGTGHWLQLERPEAVVNAVREIAEALRVKASFRFTDN